jgi:hypothetical protein
MLSKLTIRFLEGLSRSHARKNPAGVLVGEITLAVAYISGCMAWGHGRAAQYAGLIRTTTTSGQWETAKMGGPPDSDQGR